MMFSNKLFLLLGMISKGVSLDATMKAAWIKAWNTLHPFIFPCTPKTTQGLILLLFWHSIFYTSTTPLSRVWHKTWEFTPFPITHHLVPDYLSNRFLGGLPDERYPMDSSLVQVGTGGNEETIWSARSLLCALVIHFVFPNGPSYRETKVSQVVWLRDDSCFLCSCGGSCPQSLRRCGATHGSAQAVSAL